MPRLTNKFGDSIDVKCGGAGGDNVLGTVEEASSGGTSTPVGGAAVVVSNMSQAGEVAEATTNGSGAFDVDVDAECNNLIYVSATWKDGGGRIHVVKGRFRCDPCKKAQPAASTDARLASIALIEDRILEQIVRRDLQQDLVAALQEQAADAVIADLNALRELDKAGQQNAIDERMAREIVNLLRKLHQARESGAPSTQQMMDLIEEMILLLLKFTAKLFWLQGRPWPEFERPRPGGGGTA